jgi:uncharacterized OB-fold protein
MSGELEARVRHQTLYRLTKSGGIQILGSCCTACGRVSCPAAKFGCGHCGAAPERQEEATLSGKGVLDGFVIVNLDLPAERKGPFTVGVISLREGPVIEAVLQVDTEQKIKKGDSVHAVAAAVDPEVFRNNSPGFVECRFAIGEGQ